MAIPVYSTGDVPTATDVNNWFVNTKFARKAANTPRSSTTTLADDPDLQLTVLGASMYHATVCLRHQSPNAADVAFQFVGPAGSSFDHIISSITIAGAVFTDDNTYGGTISTPTSSGGITGNIVPIFVEGLLVTTTSGGTFKLQWAQSVTNASASTLLANSFMVLRQVS